MKREPFFECVLVSEESEYRFHFRAWTAEEAEHHLRTELRNFNIVESGELRILDLSGHLLRTGMYNSMTRRTKGDASPAAMP